MPRCVASETIACIMSLYLSPTSSLRWTRDIFARSKKPQTCPSTTVLHPVRSKPIFRGIDANIRTNLTCGNITVNFVYSPMSEDRPSLPCIMMYVVQQPASEALRIASVKRMLTWVNGFLFGSLSFSHFLQPSQLSLSIPSSTKFDAASILYQSSQQ